MQLPPRTLAIAKLPKETALLAAIDSAKHRGKTLFSHPINMRKHQLNGPA
jgi:hypothetical protein